MSIRHPLPYGFAKANTLLLEDDGERLVLWAPESVPLTALSEVLRVYDVDALEREAAPSLASRIAAAYAGSESSAATVIGEVESAVDLSRMMQDLPAVEDLLEAANDAPIIRMLNALLTQAAKDGASDIHIEPFQQRMRIRYRIDGFGVDVFEGRHAGLILAEVEAETLEALHALAPQRVRVSGSARSIAGPTTGGLRCWWPGRPCQTGSPRAWRTGRCSAPARQLRAPAARPSAARPGCWQ